ncbi:MAG: adenylate/guanylate cyclase domain-containing protein [Granulosicoccus sp.]
MTPISGHNLRLYSGLVIAVFLVIHLLTAALGLISLSAMDAVGRVMHEFWSIPVFLILLYGAFAVHIVMGLIALLQQRTWRLPVWNVLQIVLGLALPILLIGHAMGTRGADVILDIQRSYSDVLIQLWSNSESVLRQYALVVIAWFHLCIGIHFWLRHNPSYSRSVLVLYPLSLIIPMLAGLGFARAGFDTWQLQPETVAQLTAAIRSVDPAAQKMMFLFSDRLLQLFGLLVLLVLVIRFVRDLRFHHRGDFTVTHTANSKVARGKPGQSVLDVLREAGIAHASVCGGRGRCTTCRIRVHDEKSELPQPTPLEAAALQRVGAAPNVRLACQLRPPCDLTMTPLLQADTSAPSLNTAAAVMGHEQAVACMFCDMRGSTTLGEKKMPYDVVFILNHFFIQLADALRATNGHYANFTGDGLMGLYGLDSDIETGCREALEGAIDIQRRMDKLNSWLAEELDEPLRVGIGIHCGVAIVGTMGPPDSPITSAIGDNINIAARLEALTKEYDTNLLVSEDVLKHGKLDYSQLPRHTAKVRGRGKSVEVFVVDDPASLLGSRINLSNPETDPG